MDTGTMTIELDFLDPPVQLADRIVQTPWRVAVDEFLLNGGGSLAAPGSDNPSALLTCVVTHLRQIRQQGGKNVFNAQGTFALDRPPLRGRYAEQV